MTASLPIYLDHHATTPVDPRVFEAMRPYFLEQFGNAGSVHHAYGQRAAEAVERARAQVADLLSVSPREIVWTSGATESNNLALKGILGRKRGLRLITSAIEHRAILAPAKRLQRQGTQVTILPVEPDGRINLSQLAEALREETTLVSLQAANNEVGTIQPLEEIAALCRERGALLHSDAAQAVGKIPLDLHRMPVSLLSFSGHKLYAPKGIGVLVVRRGDRRVRLDPLFDGGGQEERLRSGTLPVPLIVGLGTACVLARNEMAAEAMRLGSLRDRLWNLLQSQITELTRNSPEEGLPGNLNVSVAGVDGEALMMALTDIAVSPGAACSTAEPEPSHVLRALGVPDDLSRASVRFGIGRFNTAEEIDRAAAHLVEVVNRLRAQRRAPS